MNKSLLVLGGNGNLGRAMVNSFKMKNWKCLSVDFTENSQADSNLVLDKYESLQSQLPLMYKQTSAFSKEFDSILCVSGGFQIASIRDEDVLEKYLEIDRSCFQSALLAGHLSTKFLGPNGMLMFTGAAAVFEGPVNFAYGYAMSKAATHHLALQMAERTEIPENSTVVTILPQIIDSEQNRFDMPDADHKTWAPPDKIADLVRGWA